MSIDQADLLLGKAATKSLAHHFKKSASHHEAMAGHHEKCMKAHEACADHHESMMGKAEDAGHSHHKAKAQFHKSMAGHHEKMHKAHSSHADHNKAMAEACASGDANKIFKAIGEEVPVSATVPPVTTATADPAAQPTAPANPAPAVPSTTTETTVDFASKVNTALDNQLEKAIDAAFERVLASQEFNTKVEKAISDKMLEKLGATSASANTAIIAPVAVPRTNGTPTTAAPLVYKRDTSLDPALQDICKID
jgi:hypothetical protein